MNEHATMVLDAYLDAAKLSVPHAILIEGRWGSGKTHFLQNVYEPARIKRMKEHKAQNTPFLFVSLFGVSSARDAEMRIYKTACPGEAVAGGIAGNIVLGIGEFLRVKEATKKAVEQFGDTAIKRLNEYVFVFDDIERVEESAFGEMMGLINSFVAEHGRRVILVADEGRLKNRVNGQIWKDYNEKIVGRRARIEPDLTSVVEGFIEKLPETPTKKLMVANTELLLRVAQASEVENLRNLSWGMHNATTFIDCLLADADIPLQHATQTMAVVLATTLWLRSDMLNMEALKRLPNLSMTLAALEISRRTTDGPEDAPLNMAKSFSETFSWLQVDTPPIDYEFVNSFEKSGVLAHHEVNSWIKSQFGFGKDGKEPSWRRLWHSHERPIAETEEAVKDLADELGDYRHTESGPILHAAGLAIRHWLADDPRITCGEDVVQFFKRYIDHLATQDLLSTEIVDGLRYGYDSAGGLGFSSIESAEFQEIFNHLVSRVLEVKEKAVRARVGEIFQEAEAGSPEALYVLINNSEGDIARTPVLLNVPAERLAALMAQDVPALRVGTKLLAYRYHDSRVDDPLLQEIPWARDVVSSVDSRLNDWPEPHRSLALQSMKGLIRHYEGGRQPDDRILPS